MPGNEAEDGIYNLYVLDDTSQGLHLSEAAGSNWPALDCGHWKPTDIGLLPSLSLKNYSLEQLGCGRDSNLSFNQAPTKLIPGADNSSHLTTNRLLNRNDISVGYHNFESKGSLLGSFGESTCYDQQTLTPTGIFSFKSQKEYGPAESPTMTTNSERSEITEISSDIHFLKGKQLIAMEQHLSTPRSYPMQQSNDMQLLQQHMMFKQLQEIQRQQQHQQLGEVRQSSPLNQLASIGQQVAGAHFSPFINGTPVHDASQMFRNWTQQGASPFVQGVPNNTMFSQGLGHAPQSMVLAPQQLDVTSYDTPMSGTRINLGQYPHLQGAPQDSVHLAGGQSPKPTMQSHSFGSYLGDQNPLDVVGLMQQPLMTRQGFQEKCNFGELPVQGRNAGVFPGNFQCCTLQSNVSLKEFNVMKEEADLCTGQQINKQSGPSQALVLLDPMEAKILYNMDDGNIWDAFECHPEMGAGGCNSALENPDSSNGFPSVQSGSWSALMQSAVAEASSSDTGIQEEWSGLTFQNTEHSNDNQISNFVESEREQKGWLDNNFQGSSFGSKTVPIITDSAMSSSFPGLQQPGIHLSVEQRGEDMCQSGSCESIENCDPQLMASVERAQMVQPWAGQKFDYSWNDGKHQKIASSDIYVNKGHESMQKSHQEINNAPHAAHIYSNETIESQWNYQNENANGHYTYKTLKAHEQGNFESFHYFGNISGNPMTMDKESLLDIEENSQASEGIPSRGNHGSHNFHVSVLPDGSNGSAQTSEHMLELLHKVDQSRDDSIITPFGSFKSIQPFESRSQTQATSFAQLYSQMSVTQGFGLRLSPPSQGLTKSNSFLSPQCLPQNVSNLNSNQMNPKLVEKSQAWLGPPCSFPSSPSSQEPSQSAYSVNKSGILERMALFSNPNVQGSPLTPFPLNPSNTRSQHQMHPMPNVPMASQSMQLTLSGAAGRNLLFNQACSQDTLEQMCATPAGQQFPVLDTLPVSPPFVASSMSQRVDNSGKPYKVWRNVPSSQQPPVVEPFKFPSPLPSSMHPSNNMTTSWALCVPNDQNYVKGGHNPLEFGVSSSSQNLGQEMSQQQVPSEVVDPSLSGGAFQRQEFASDATALASGLSFSHSQHQYLDGARHGHNTTSATGKRNLDAFVQAHDNIQNYSFVNQVQTMNSPVNSVSQVQHTSAFGRQLLNGTASGFRQAMDSGPNSVSQPTQFPSQDSNILSFSGEARDISIGKASSQPALLVRPPHDIITFGHSSSQCLSSNNNVPSSHTNYSLANAGMSPSWPKQSSSLRNGQTVPIFDAGPAKTAASQVALGKPSQDLHVHNSLEQYDIADGIQRGRVRPSKIISMAGPCILPLKSLNQMAKKRKINTIELLPWHKEVMEDFKRLQNISKSEQDWAQATNRLIEKVEDVVEVIEGVQPMLRSKRRLILTTQLMQQLFHPAPASLFSADPTTNYDLILYFISRLSLGDACSLTYSKRNDLLVPINYNSISEKVKVSQTSGQQIVEVMENLIESTKKLENGFQRLDKTSSVVDLRVELEELERFAVINRFAKFHVRGQTDTSGTSSFGTSKPIPQRYVTAFPMPRNLPEAVQCLSL